ncbi:sulfatase family protein, partial [Vibrio parahaemolyticus AQ3810]
KLKIPAL